MGFDTLIRSDRIGWGVRLILLCGVVVYLVGQSDESEQLSQMETGGNRSPVAQDINITVRRGTLDEKGYLEIELVAKDSEADSLKYFIVTPPKYGKIDGEAPHIRYVPPADFVGDDWFVFGVENGHRSDVGTVLIQVRRHNQPPRAKDDHKRTLIDRKVYLDLLKNDRDNDGTIDPDSLEILHVPLHGKVRRAKDGLLYYIPDPGFEGRDYFSYKVADNEGAYSDPAQVIIDVEHINYSPVAVDDNVSIEENQTIAIPVLLNDYDGDGALDEKTLMIVESPKHGEAKVVEGEIFYTPLPGYQGQDRLGYRVSDQENMYSNEAMVLIQVISSTDTEASSSFPGITEGVTVP